MELVQRQISRAVKQEKAQTLKQIIHYLLIIKINKIKKETAVLVYVETRRLKGCLRISETGQFHCGKDAVLPTEDPSVLI